MIECILVYSGPIYYACYPHVITPLCFHTIVKPESFRHPLPAAGGFDYMIYCNILSPLKVSMISKALHHLRCSASVKSLNTPCEKRYAKSDIDTCTKFG